ncbi:MAG: ABC transporter substrate-binding protein [Anaerolineales bacterium]
MFRRLYWLTTILLVMAVAITACQPAADEPVVEEPVVEEPTSPPAEEPTDEPVVEEPPEETRGVLRYNTGLAYGGLENLDPVDESRFWPPISLLFDRLAAPAENELRPVPSLAESWESNAAGDVWTFHLREDVYFHDGTQLTSADVAYSANHWKTSETSIIASSFAVVDNVETPDDFTVVFNLTAPVVDFPLLVMDYRARVMPVDGLPDILETGLGSGPFILETLDVEGITVLVANDDYWGGPPGVAAIEVLTIADTEAAIQALLAGQIDFSVDAVVEQAKLFEGNDDYVITQIPGGNWSGFVMRTDIPPFDNLALRQAMHLVVDRQTMVDLALSGAGTVSCDSAVMPGDPYLYTCDDELQDIDGAKAKLEEAGYAGGFEIDLYTADVCSDWTALTEIYQQQAALADITVNIVTVSSDGFWTEAWMVQPFVMTCWNERTADQALNEIFRSGGAWNESYWNVPEYDALLDAARAETDFDTRRQHYLDAQKMLHEEGGTIIPYYSSIIRVQKSCVEGIPDMGIFFVDWTGITKPASCD